MSGSKDRFRGEEISFADMAEAPRMERESKAKNIAVMAGSAIAVLVLVIVLIRGSLPAMTPQEIVKLDDYEGQQPPRHIFNLYSLKNDKLQRESNPKAQDELVVSDGSLQAETSTVAVATLSESGADIVAQGPMINELESPPAAAEEPVALVSQEIVLAALVPEKAVLSDDVSLPSLGSENNSPVSKQISVNGEDEAPVLPVYTINANQTNLRSRPTLDAPVLKRLNEGHLITVFDNNGSWVQVATNDGAGTTGYVHSSLLEIANIDQ